ncbi:MAG: hypothetical protein KIT24_09615 [Phycisphaeraceae bacterium]|nr:hypothetical protein [Phycisphaeraceae bacterium]
MQITIEYDPATVKGAVTIRQSGGLSDIQLWEACNRQLAQRGLTTIIAPGAAAYSVVSLQAAAASARIEPGIRSRGGLDVRSQLQISEQVAMLTRDHAAPVHAQSADKSPARGLRADLPPGFISILYRPEHRTAADLAEPLRIMLGRSGGHIGVLGDTGLLTISDLSARVDQMIGLIDIMDSARGRILTREYTSRHLAADRLVTLTRELARKREAAGGGKLVGDVHPSADDALVVVLAPEQEFNLWLSLLDIADRLEPVETRLHRSEGLASPDLAALISRGVKSDDRLNIRTDPLSGSLLVTATKSQHDAIESLLDRLEQSTTGSVLSMRSFVVRNRPAADVLGVLERMAAAGVLGWRTHEPPHLSPPKGFTDERFPMAVDPPQPHGARSSPSASFLLDEGTSTIIAVATPRVLERIEELVRTLDVRQQQVALSVLLISLSESQTHDLGAELRGSLGIGGVDIKLSSLFGLSTVGGEGLPPLGASPGFGGVVLSPGEFSAVIRALETVNRGRTLSMPTIVVSNAQQASVNSVLQQPYVSVNASDTVATTSFGGTQDAGTQVTLTPQISTGDHIILEYSITLSTFVGESAAPGIPPPRQQNTLRSVVTIPAGFTIVVGGIELQNTSSGESRVPVLGNLPIIGELAKSQSRTGGRQRFYAFIRPTILRDVHFEDLKFVSDMVISQTGVDSGWPELIPRMILPPAASPFEVAAP